MYFKNKIKSVATATKPLKKKRGRVNEGKKG
jgi:hypothetical protein